jgi:glycosyltransferase involved in cell wall biosynthesis
VAVSERDAALLRAMSPAARVHVVPNGVDGEWFAPLGECRAAEELLFFGSLSYGPNVEGLAWFCQQILPRVQQSRPGVSLEIVGFNPVPGVAALGELPGVKVTGFVPDIRTRLWSAALSVVPLRSGGGTRLKVLEALAAGCPVVSTSLGAEGLSLKDEEHLLLADTPDEFARDVLRLLASPGLRRRVAEAGRKAVAQNYDWRQIASLLDAACVDAAGRGNRP